MKLHNGLIALEFDDHNGCLRSLKDLRSGYEHLARPQDATLFRLIAPSETWQSRYMDAQFQQAHLELDGTRLKISYASLKTAPVNTKGECDLLPVRVTVTVDLPPGSPEAFLVMEIENHSQSPLVEAWFPKLGGWTGAAEARAATEARAGAPEGANFAPHRLTPGYQGYFDQLNPYASPLGADWTTFLRWDKRWSVRYPWATFLPWLDVSGGGRGLWLIDYMQEAYMGGFAAENVAGGGDLSLTFGWFSIIEVAAANGAGAGAAGQRWQSQRFGLGLHHSDWHETARHYRQWLKTWWRPVEPPARLKKALGIQQVIFSNFDGEPVRPFSQLPAVVEAGLKYGITDVCIWDYLMLGTYGRTNPTEQTNYPAEQWEELRQALAAAHRLGASVSMLINNRLVSPTSHFYRRRGSPGVMRMRDGSPRPEPTPVSGRSAESTPQWMGPQALVMCQRSQEFRREVNYHLERLMEVGFDAFFIDQSFEILPCYDAHHGHTRPDDTHQAAVEWIGDFRQKLKQRYPEGYLIGEMPDVFMPQVMDLLWNWNWFRRSPDIMAYSMPLLYNAWVTDCSLDFAQQGFLYGLMLMFTTNGLEGTLDDAPPAFRSLVGRLAGLRAQTAYCTVGAQFEDCDALRCEGGVAKRYSYAGGSAVILINPSDQAAPARLQIEPLPGAAPFERGTLTRLYRLDGEQREICLAGESPALELTLQPREALVWDLPQGK